MSVVVPFRLFPTMPFLFLLAVVGGAKLSIPPQQLVTALVVVTGCTGVVRLPHDLLLSFRLQGWNFLLSFLACAAGAQLTVALRMADDIRLLPSR